MWVFYFVYRLRDCTQGNWKEAGLLGNLCNIIKPHIFSESPRTVSLNTAEGVFWNQEVVTQFFKHMQLLSHPVRQRGWTLGITAVGSRTRIAQKKNLFVSSIGVSCKQLGFYYTDLLLYKWLLYRTHINLMSAIISWFPSGEVNTGRSRTLPKGTQLEKAESNLNPGFSNQNVLTFTPAHSKEASNEKKWYQFEPSLIGCCLI